jgi:hypothetical protein
MFRTKEISFTNNEKIASSDLDRGLNCVTSK